MDDSGRKPIAERRTPKAWVWFFVALAVLAVAAIGINWSYNLAQQMKPEDLRAAMDRWKAKGPRDYDLLIRRDVSGAGSTGEATREEIKVAVRNGKAASAALNGRPLEARLLGEYDMDGLFDDIERFQEIDHKPGAPRTFVRGRFDPADGHVIEYVRRVSGTHERQMLRVVLTPAGE